MGAGDYIEIHDDFFVFKQGRKSPRKVYWKEISGLAFSGNKHFLPFSVMNVFEETGNMEPQTIVLLDSTYEQYKKMWEDMILLSIKVKKQPWHGILCFFTICIGVLFYIIFIGYTALWDYLL